MQQQNVVFLNICQKEAIEIGTKKCSNKLTRRLKVQFSSTLSFWHAFVYYETVSCRNSFLLTLFENAFIYGKSYDQKCEVYKAYATNTNISNLTTDPCKLLFIILLWLY